MISKNWFKIGLAGLVLAGSLYFIANRQNDSQGQSQHHNQKPKIVSVGQIEYNKGDLVSYDFVSCSAVIFDYDSCAFMAHAIPELESEFDRETIAAGNVIGSLIRDSEKQGFNPKEAKVYINAGNKESLDKIVEQLRAKNIPITKAELRFPEDYVANSSDSRVIKYNPLRNELRVFKENEFPDYREPTNPSNWEGP